MRLADEFCFWLTGDEFKILKSQIVTSSWGGGGAGEGGGGWVTKGFYRAPPSTRHREYMNANQFWPTLDNLVLKHRLIIDRPKDSQHPIHKSIIYPFDYGHLEGTKSGDGDGVDVWIGSLSTKTVNAIICTIDVDDSDFEMKILVGCTHEDCIKILEIHNGGPQFGLLVERPN